MTQHFRDETGWQESAGYSRAVRRGDVIAVSGTTADGPDTYAQATAALERIVAAVVALGGRREDVVRTVVYLAPAASWTDATRAHREAFEGVWPANTTLFVHGLVGPEFLVEIEATAVCA